MRLLPRAIAALLFCLLTGLAGTAGAADERIEAAKALTKAGKYAQAAAAWQVVLDELPKDLVVTNGDAHWFAAQANRNHGEIETSIALLRAYLKKHADEDGAFRASRGLFLDLAGEADDAATQTLGKKHLARWPSSRGSYGVAATYLRRGWKLPKLKSSYAAIRSWTYDRTSVSKDPDLRIAFIELIERRFPKEDAVKDGSTLYTKGYGHHMAGRQDEAIKLFRKYLARRDDNLETVTRYFLAEALLALDPPDMEKARKHLAAVSKTGGKYGERADRRLQGLAAGGAARLKLADGFPQEDGLGKVVVLTSYAAGSAERKALKPLIDFHGAKVERFEIDKTERVPAKLKKHGAEFVIVAVPALVIDINFHYDILEICRDLDDDPLPDFHFGYFVAREPSDLAALAERTVRLHEAARKTAAMATVPLTKSNAKKLTELDAVLHFGHGSPWDVNDGMTGVEVGRLELPRAPLVVSGACFNGVCSRSYHPSAYQPIHLRPQTIDPSKLMTLNWVTAGVSGYLAALEADRGEMAIAEWSRLRQHAEPQGAVIGHQYRTVFTSLPANFKAFRRYRLGVTKDTSFYRVMLRGAVSRLLIGDPSLRPLAAPVDEPALAFGWVAGGGGHVLTARVVRFDQGTSQEYLPTSGDRFRQRMYVRAAVPEGADALGAHTVTLRRDKGELRPAAVRLYDEVWGGRRYVNLKIESNDGSLGSPGTTMTCIFAVAK